MEWLQQLSDGMNSILWGPVMILFMVGVGVYFTLFTRCFQLTRWNEIWHNTIATLFARKGKKEKKKGEITPFQAMSTALAGTIGTGNIAGVATALVAGGPGSVFWMWISGAFGMMTKYAEVVLAMHYRNINKKGEYSGGPMQYIEKGLGMRWLSVVFSVLCIMASFGVGNMTQVNSIAEAMFSALHIPPVVTGAVVALICGLVLLGGSKIIPKVTEKVVPFMTVFYLLGTIVCLLVFWKQIPKALSLIFAGAFTPTAAAGGVAGYTVRQAVQFGVARGIFTNEAGLGSAPIAHAASSNQNPVTQGMWGIIEVFIDTILMCTITALVLLTAGDGTIWMCGLDGAALTTAAFSSVFGSFGGMFIAVAILFFAVASILGWAFYGQKAMEYIFKDNKQSVLLYRFFYIAVIFLGATANLKVVWSMADTFNGLMSLPNLLAILVLSPVVFRITGRYQKNKKEKNEKGVK